MSENNLPNEEFENETAESQIAENEETTQETFENVAEETMQQPEETVVENETCCCKPVKTYKTSAIIAWVLVAILAIVDVYYYMTNIFNRYNHIGYLNVSGYTLGDAAAGMGMDVETFKEMYGLPKDMRKDTYMEAAQSCIPCSVMASLNGMDFQVIKEQYNFGEEITESSTWGEALESMQLKDYVGETNFEEFKTTYGFGDEVTLETKWGEIRKIVEKKDLAERLAEEAEEAEEAKEKNEEAEPTDDVATPEADAEGETDAQSEQEVAQESETAE